jgi:hypothetical protein
MPNKSGLARTLALPINGRLDLGNTPSRRLLRFLESILRQR